MNQISRISFAYTLLMIAALLFIIHGYRKNDYKGRDIVYYNDCLLSMCEEYAAGKNEAEIEAKYGCNIVLSKELVGMEMTDYYSSGALVLDFAPEGEYIGKVVWDDINENLEQVKNYTRKTIVIFWAIVLALGYLLICLVWRFLIRPVNEMNKYAAEIAKGNLDVPLPIHKHNLFGAFTESFDIMREELKASRQRENELKRKEKELVAQLSHDLKTPITGINTICDVMSVKTEDEYLRGKIEGIQSKTEQMENLVNDLLTSTLDDIGEMTVNCTDERSGVLREIVAASDPKGVVREEDIPECMIRVDMKRMPQVIGNIIANSYKYAGTAIDIGYSITGDYLKMTISDHGSGVPAEELDLITNKFYRGEGVKESEIEGSGLGLYTASTLMAKMHGELICSSKGEGLTVTLMILLSK